MKNNIKDKKEWSREHVKCVVCSGTDIEHCAKGMCNICYEKNRRKTNPEKERARCRKYRKLNKEEVKKYNKKYYKKYYEKNREKIISQTGRYAENKYRNDFSFKLKKLVSHSIRQRLKSRLLSKNCRSTFTFLPYTVDELVQHLENLFQPGMTWENYGEWHIDHKVPDCKFNYKSIDDEEFQKCWALRNLQPLWAIDNMKKGGRVNNLVEQNK